MAIGPQCARSYHPPPGPSAIPALAAQLKCLALQTLPLMETGVTSESLAAIPEGQLVRRLLDNDHWRGRILRIHGIPDGVQYFPEVDLDGLNAKGDVDILAVDPGAPHLATAVQVKRVRVSERSFATDGKPNKLNEVAKLKRQASLLVELGFWQVFAFVFVVVDSRVRNTGRYAFDGMTPQLRAKVDQGINTDGLHAHAGFIVYEFTQPMDDHPLSTGTFGGRIVRMPTCSVQHASVTSWVANCVEIWRRLKST